MVKREVDRSRSQGGSPPAASRLARFRIIPPLETYPWLVEFVQEALGKAILLVLFAMALRPLTNLWVLLTLMVSAIAVLPQYRRALVTAGTLLALIFHNGWIKWALLAQIADQAHLPGTVSIAFKSASLILFLGLCALCWRLVMRFGNSMPARRPVLFLTLVYAATLVSASIAGPGRLRIWLWCLTVLLGGYFWSVCYSLTDRNPQKRDSFWLQLGTYHPMWIAGVPTTTPYAKGAIYLRKTEAKSPAEFAVTQLKGLKLLLWALILAVVLDVFLYLVHGQPGAFSKALCIPVHFALPRFDEALERSVAGAPYPWYICWASVVADFVRVMLNISVAGHLIIACCRMAGFRAARNTYSPLRARDIADFWNRYYFYFKEVMVEFFFFPTYMRYFKRHPRLRMMTATFAAAGLGNAIFHFMRDIEPVAEMGIWRSLVGFQSYALYALLLSAGIGISQLRTEHKTQSDPPTWFRARVVTPVLVLFFYCVLQVFDDTGHLHPLTERFVFLMSMFGFGK